MGAVEQERSVYNGGDRRERAFGIAGVVVLEALVLLAFVLASRVVLHPSAEMPALSSFEFVEAPMPEPPREPDSADKAPDRGQRAVEVADRQVIDDTILPAPEILIAPRPERSALDLTAIAEISSGIADIGSGGGDVGNGNGPGGAHLFDARWYRRPTLQEMAPYIIDHGAETGWAAIACRTAPDFRVVDCVGLDEADAPTGSNLQQAVLEASERFLVRPPESNGKALIGVWVRIRISYGI